MAAREVLEPGGGARRELGWNADNQIPPPPDSYCHSPRSSLPLPPTLWTDILDPRVFDEGNRRRQSRVESKGDTSSNPYPRPARAASESGSTPASPPTPGAPTRRRRGGLASLTAALGVRAGRRAPLPAPAAPAVLAPPRHTHPHSPPASRLETRSGRGRAAALASRRGPGRSAGPGCAGDRQGRTGRNSHRPRFLLSLKEELPVLI